MTKKSELYRCNVCQNLIEILSEGNGELVCCNQPMELLKENCSESENLADKHVPVIEKITGGYKIRVGAKKHPMSEEHHINFIQVISKDGKYVKTKFLSLEDEPESDLKCDGKSIWARALCNIHGLFKNNFD